MYWFVTVYIHVFILCCTALIFHALPIQNVLRWSRQLRSDIKASKLQEYGLQMLELSYRGERLMNELALHSEVGEVGSNDADVTGFPNDNLIILQCSGCQVRDSYSSKLMSGNPHCKLYFFDQLSWSMANPLPLASVRIICDNGSSTSRHQLRPRNSIRRGQLWSFNLGCKSKIRWMMDWQTSTVATSLKLQHAMTVWKESWSVSMLMFHSFQVSFEVFLLQLCLKHVVKADELAWAPISVSGNVGESLGWAWPSLEE